ncbi:hypothetical protein EJB05_15880, partial [Eragrostis curvula]
ARAPVHAVQGLGIEELKVTSKSSTSHRSLSIGLLFAASNGSRSLTAKLAQVGVQTIKMVSFGALQDSFPASMNGLVRLPSHRCVELDGSAANLLLHTTHMHSKSGRAVFYSQRRVQRERGLRFGLGARAGAVASRDDSGSRFLSTRGVFCKKTRCGCPQA